MTNRQTLRGLHDISKMILAAAEMHRQHTRLLIVLIEAGANPTDVVNEMRANEEMFCGYLTRISASVDLLRAVEAGKVTLDAAGAVLPGNEPEGAPV